MAENAEGAKKMTPVEAWDKTLLAMCEAVLVTPTAALSSQRWSEIDFTMRKLEALVGELRNGERPAPAETEA